MCGIAGVLKFGGTPVTESELTALNGLLKHRGPDGEGAFIKKCAGLAHRRLSIIDSVGGAQPMVSEDGSCALTFNGEIYNFRELREELKGKGATFRTNSDTEVVLQAWRAWGSGCVERFRGMFAFAVVDFGKKCLFLARDPFGIKPLCYFLEKDRLVFASELQALKPLNPPRELDLQALGEYLAIGYVPAPLTIFRGVCKLEPGRRMTIGFDGKTSGPESYWELGFGAGPRGDYQECAEELERVLRESVKAHLVSDVPFGAFLSGGMDSSLVVSFMAQELGARVKTFSIGFEGAGELPYAETVARKWNTDHTAEIVRADAVSVLPLLAQHYGEPFADASAVPVYYLSRLAKASVSMVLSGDGGDEAFGGYRSYRRWLKSIYPERNPWKKLLYPAARMLWPSRFGGNLETLERWRFIIEWNRPEERRSLWRPEIERLTKADIFEQLWAQAPGSGLDRVRWMDYKTYLPGDILNKVDIASMAHGLEVRTPFIDARVLEFVSSLPHEFLVHKIEVGEWTGKRILRTILKKYFSADFVDRPKKGFNPPVQGWMGDKAVRDYFRETVLRPDARLGQYLDTGAISHLFESYPSNPSSADTLWALLFLEVWLRTN